MTLLGKLQAAAVGVGVMAAFGTCVRKMMTLSQQLIERDEMLEMKEQEMIEKEEQQLVSTENYAKEVEREHEEKIGKIKEYYTGLIRNREEEIEALGRKVDEMQSVNTQLSIDIDEKEEELQEIIGINGELEFRVEHKDMAIVQLSQRVQELEDRALQLPDFYKLLNLNRYDNPSEFKIAYRKAIRDGHPDKLKLEHPSEEDKERARQRSNTISRAYTVLSNPELRMLYHRWLDMTELRLGEAKLHRLN